MLVAWDLHPHEVPPTRNPETGHFSKSLLQGLASFSQATSVEHGRDLLVKAIREILNNPGRGYRLSGCIMPGLVEFVIPLGMA